MDTLYLNLNKLSGTIHTEIGLLTSLNILRLGPNKLTGTIPSELGQLANMEVLSVAANTLTGRIPSELGTFTQVKEIWTDYNSLSGEVPEELGALANNDVPALLSLIYNPMLSGTLPETICSLETLYFDCTGLLCGCGCGCSEEGLNELNTTTVADVHGQ